VELHKLADIEKLARNVKQKMSTSFGGGPSLGPSSQEPMPYPMQQMPDMPH